MERVLIKPQTGSLLILHSSDIGAIAAFAREQLLFQLQDNGNQARRPEARAPIGKLPRLNPLALIAAGFAGIGFYQAWRGQILGNAVESFWNGYQLKNYLRSPGMAAAFMAMGLYQVRTGRWFGPASSLLFYAWVAHRLARFRQ